MMKRRAEKRISGTIMIRLTSILVAVVFVLGMMFVPADLFAVEAESVSGDSEISADVIAEEADGDELSEEETIADEAEPEVAEAPVNQNLSALVVAADENGNSVGLEEIDEDAYDGFLYKIDDSATNKEIKEMEKAIDDLDADQEVSEVIEKELYAADSIDTIEEVADAGMIDSIEPDYIMSAFEEPNDELYDQYAWQVELTNIPYIWDMGATGEGAVVAVLDSGVNTAHKDLAGVTFVNKHNVFDESADVTDYFGHGTEVAGVIAETRNNGIGFAGAMSKTSIMPVKVLNDRGTTSVSVAIRGIAYAVEKKADVINMSFGGHFEGVSSTYLEMACEKAAKAGAIIVAAAGNEADKGNPVMYPAAYDSVVSVGSVDKNMEWSYFSTHNDQVTVVAPGEDIIVLNGLYDYYETSGTSFSTPQAAALAAMAKSLDSGISPSEFTQILIDTSKDLGVKGYDEYYGYGLIDFAKCHSYIENRPPLVKAIKSPKRGKKKLTVRWKAMSKSQKKKYKKSITGYQVRVSKNSDFKGAKYKKVKGITKTSVTVKGLKKKTTYYVQYRSYKTVGSEVYYSKWSSKKKAKTK